MTIKKDAGKILLFMYQRYIENQSITEDIILHTTNWEGARMNRAIDYLMSLGVIQITPLLGENSEGVQNFIFEKITAKGIDMIENQPEFNRNFDFTVNLGVISFSWGASEK